MFGYRSGYLNNWGLLEGVCADHAAGDLAGDGDEGDAVEECIGETADEVGGAGAGGGDADAGEAGGARVALGGEDAALLVAGEDVADNAGARERLVDLHRRATGVGEDVPHPLALQGLNEDVGALAGLVGAEAGDECLRLQHNGGGGGGRGGLRGRVVGERVGDNVGGVEVEAAERSDGVLEDGDLEDWFWGRTREMRGFGEERGGGRNIGGHGWVRERKRCVVSGGGEINTDQVYTHTNTSCKVSAWNHTMDLLLFCWTKNALTLFV